MNIRFNTRGVVAVGLAGLAILAAGCGRSAPTAGGASSATTAGADASAQAGSGGLTDGVYDCGGGYTFRAMGNIDIKGGQFRYRPYGDVVDGYHPYSVDGGNIQWGGKMGGLDEPPAAVVSSNKIPTGFNVNYKGNPNGIIDTMSCNLMAGAQPPG